MNARRTKISQIANIVFVITSVAFSNNALAKPLKVFILAGQSNMQGHAQVRTFEHIGMDPQTAPLLERMQNDNGTPRVCENVWISSLSTSGEKVGRLTTGFGADDNKIGPELTFGITVADKLNEPILIIKTAWGGKSLHTDFRPPSAGPYRFNETQLEQLQKQGKDPDTVRSEKAKATGRYYRLTVDHVKKVLTDIKRVYPNYDAKNGYELAGMVWFQGWNDMVDQGTYPNRGFTHRNFRDAMAAPAELDEFQGNVSVVLTEQYWDMELTRLRARQASVQQAVKKRQTAEKLSNQQWRAIQDEAISNEFTGQELEVLRKGISNAEYHYLGSAKIMAQIGKGFAEAVLQLQVHCD